MSMQGQKLASRGELVVIDVVDAGQRANPSSNKANPCVLDAIANGPYSCIPAPAVISRRFMASPNWRSVRP